MNIEIVSKTLDTLSKEERRRLNYLTLKRNSLMRDDVMRAHEDLDQYQLFLAILDNTIIGWSALFPCDLSTECCSFNKYYIYTYVQSCFRRKGVGMQLLDAASQWAKDLEVECEVFAWNEDSENFFKYCAAMPINLVIDYA